MAFSKFASKVAIAGLGWALATATLAQQTATGDESRISEGVRQLESGDLDGARATFESVLAQNPDNVVAIYELALTHFQLGELERSLEVIDDALARDLTATPEFYVVSASALDQLGRADEARRRFEQGIAAFPDNHSLHVNLAITQGRAGDRVAAQSTFEKAAVLKPEHPTAHFYLGQLYASEGRIAAAILALGMSIGFENQPQRMATSAGMIKSLLENGVQLLDDGTPMVVLPVESALPAETLEELSDRLPRAYATAIAIQRKQDGDLTYEPYANAFALTVAEFVDSPIDPATDFAAGYYRQFYAPMTAAGHVDAFAHLIMGPLNAQLANEWVQANSTKLDAFRVWARSRTSTIER